MSAWWDNHQCRRQWPGIQDQRQRKRGSGRSKICTAVSLPYPHSLLSAGLLLRCDTQITVATIARPRPIFGLGYYEDTDFSMRAKSAGSSMMICEDAFVYHVGGASFSSNPKARELIKRNKKIFLQRHPNAVLHHKREGNLAALEEYAKLQQEGLWNDGLALRAKRRIETLLSDLPRSLIKKWLWLRKIRKILHHFIIPNNANRGFIKNSLHA